MPRRLIANIPVTPAQACARTAASPALHAPALTTGRRAAPSSATEARRQRRAAVGWQDAEKCRAASPAVLIRQSQSMGRCRIRMRAAVQPTLAINLFICMPRPWPIFPRWDRTRAQPLGNSSSPTWKIPRKYRDPSRC